MARHTGSGAGRMRGGQELLTLDRSTRVSWSFSIFLVFAAARFAGYSGVGGEGIRNDRDTFVIAGLGALERHFSALATGLAGSRPASGTAFAQRRELAGEVGTFAPSHR